MSDESFRRIALSGFLLAAIVIWGFAFNGARCLFSEATGLSVWSKTDRPVSR